MLKTIKIKTEITNPIQSNNWGEGGSGMRSVQTKCDKKTKMGKPKQLITSQNIEGE